MNKILPKLILTAAVLALGACHNPNKQKSIEALDKELTSENSDDPAVKTALEDQIMVDPQLSAKANAHSIRPPDEPYTAPLPPAERQAGKDGAVPPTLGQLAQAQVKDAKSGCNMAVGYSATWATKLPAGLPIYPQGHVSEAAGSDTPTCHLRVVSYTSAAPAQSLLDFYTTHGRQAGYAVVAANDTLSGTRAKDGAMFSVTLASANNGTSVDVVSNAGR